MHEKEMLAIIRALQKWRVDLLGSEFFVYTDHKTLENFDKQKDLSRRQACWMEFLSQYKCKIIYVKGEDNTVVDALSHTEFADANKAETAAKEPWDDMDPDEDPVPIAAVLCRGGSAPFHAAWCLARTRIKEQPQPPIASILTISTDTKFLQQGWALAPAAHSRTTW
jgi:hypothetical protein